MEYGAPMAVIKKIGSCHWCVVLLSINDALGFQKVQSPFFEPIARLFLSRDSTPKINSCCICGFQTNGVQGLCGIVFYVVNSRGFIKNILYFNKLLKL